MPLLQQQSLFLCIEGNTRLSEHYLVRAVAACETSSQFFTKELYPSEWAHIQLQLGRIFGNHAILEHVESQRSDLKRAISHFEEARSIFQKINCQSEVDYCNEALEKVRGNLDKMAPSTDASK